MNTYEVIASVQGRDSEDEPWVVAYTTPKFYVEAASREAAIIVAESILNTGIVVYGKGYDPRPVGARIVVRAVECVR